MIKITRVITADGFDGEPWPPASTDNWTVIRRLHGFTLWRAISGAPSTTADEVDEWLLLHSGFYDRPAGGDNFGF
jgi:hypothetical protein